MQCCACNNSNEIIKDQTGGASLTLDQAQYEEEVFSGKEKKQRDMSHSMNNSFENECSLGTFHWHN